jgi:5'-nucleotidase
VNLAITHSAQGQNRISSCPAINKERENLGDDVTYSGTVQARSRCVAGLASIAVSTQRVKDECEFGPSAIAAAIVAQAVLERGLPKFTLLNINTPKGPNKGFRVDRAGQAQSRAPR